MPANINSITTSNNQRLGSAGEDDAFCYNWVNKKVYVFKL